MRAGLVARRSGLLTLSLSLRRCGDFQARLPRCSGSEYSQYLSPVVTGRKRRRRPAPFSERSNGRIIAGGGGDGRESHPADQALIARRNRA